MTELLTCYVCWAEIYEGNFEDHLQWHKTLMALIKGENK